MGQILHRLNAELNPLVAETMYAPGPEGYTDYPTITGRKAA
jgi:hypothetical protein